VSRIVLTGGAGFIGSHLAERLLDVGHELVIIDDLNDFYSPAIKRRNLSEIAVKGPFEFHEINVSDLDPLRLAIGSSPPEIIIHLAARAGVRPSLEQPLLYEKANVLGTLNLLELAREYAIPQFVFASSSSIYGATSRVPFSESEANPNPISPYGVTKLAGEKLCYCYSQLYSIRTVCLRFFTVYGPRQRPDLAIHKFARLIHEDKEIPQFGDGSSLRDYTFISDIVDGIMAALGVQGSFEVFNLGNSHPISLGRMIQLLEQNLGRKARIKVQNLQPGDMLFTHADLSKATERLGYVPRVSFEEGLARFVSWFKAVSNLP
jgi:UDP-glucuronate 4-epimerase